MCIRKYNLAREGEVSRGRILRDKNDEQFVNLSLAL